MGNQSSSPALSSIYEDESYTARRGRRGLTPTGSTTNMASPSPSPSSRDDDGDSPSWMLPTMSNMDEIQHGLSFQPKTIGVQSDGDIRTRSYQRKEEYERKKELRSARIAKITQTWNDNKNRYNTDGTAISESNVVIADVEEDTKTTLLLCGLNCC